MTLLTPKTKQTQMLLSLLLKMGGLLAVVREIQSGSFWYWFEVSFCTFDDEKASGCALTVDVAALGDACRLYCVVTTDVETTSIRLPFIDYRRR